MIFNIKKLFVLDKIRKVMWIPSQIILFILPFTINLTFEIAEILAKTTDTFNRFDHTSNFQHIDFTIFVLLVDSSHVFMLKQNEWSFNLLILFSEAIGSELFIVWSRGIDEWEAFGGIFVGIFKVIGHLYY